jgi:hypothetical protein
MGEMWPPTAADYASDAAYRAHDKIAKLEEKIKHLEAWLGRVDSRVSSLEDEE